MAHLLYSADGIGDHELVGGKIYNGYANVSAAGRRTSVFGISKPTKRSKSGSKKKPTKSKAKPKSKVVAKGRKPTKKTVKKPAKTLAKRKRVVRKASGFFDDLEQGLQTVGRIVDPIANIAQKVIPVVSQIAPLLAAGPKRVVSQEEKDLKSRIAYTKKRLRESIALNKKVAQRRLMTSNGLTARDALSNVNNSLRAATQIQLIYLKLTTELRVAQETLRIYENVPGWVKSIDPLAP